MKQPKKEITLKDGTKVILRDPLVKDAKQLLEHLYITASQTQFILAYAPEVKKRTIESEKTWVRNFINGESLLLVAESEGRIIGLSEVSISKGHKTKHRGTIGISIQKDYWGLGLGSIMFDEMIAFGVRCGLMQLELGVAEANERARHLYEKKGFEYTGRIPRAILMEDGSYMDELLMARLLK